MIRARTGVLAAAAALAAATALPAAAAAAPPEGQIRAVPGAVVTDSYVVVFKSGVDAGKAAPLASRHGAGLGYTYTAGLKGFSFSGSALTARRIAADPSVDFVQPNMIHRISGVQSPTPSWGLDRIDQRNLPLNNSYTYPNTASNVKAYIIDTGIRRTHTDLGGRASVGFDAIGDGQNTNDCNGHGTHVAGTVGGGSYGVAKGVTLKAVRVLNCQGSGTTAQVVAGINWVTADHQAGQPAVANMSLGGGADVALDNAVKASIADGVTYAIAAGNGNFLGFAVDACTVSPARVPAAITVSATDNTDKKATWANRGTCVDIFAPGVNIKSAWGTGDTATNTISGTSMATPHVAGSAALYLSTHPTATPQQVRDALVNNATTGVVKSPGTGSPNRLLYVGNL
jgi:subtilisin family serine protease